MTTPYNPPLDFQDLSRADDFFLYNDVSIDNLLSLGNEAMVDHMDDLLWNVDCTKFAANDDADCKYLDTDSYILLPEVG